MATYVNDLRLTELATGEGSGTWGVTTNTNLELIGEALGYGTQDCFASDADATTTVADGATDPARAMYFKVTSSATLTATRTLTIAPNTMTRVMLIENATTGSQSIAISQGSGGNVTIASGQVKMVYLDGAGAGAAVVDAMADLELGTITVANLTATTADINGGTIDGATIATSDITVGSGKTLDVSAGTFTVANDQISGDAINGGTATPTTLTSTTVNATTVDTTNIEVTNLKAKDGTAAGSIADSTGVVTLSSSVLTTTDINGGTIDGVTIGGASAGAGTFTTLQADTSLNVDGTVTADGLTVDGAGTVTAGQAVFTISSSTTSAGNEAELLLVHAGNNSYEIKGGSDLAFSSDGGVNERLRITNAGNVGIGTTSQNERLRLNSSTAGQARLTIAYADTPISYFGSYIGIVGSGNATDVLLTSANVLAFSAGGTTERMRIDSSGKVAIGTTSTAAGTFTVDGTVVSQSAAQGSGNIQLQGYGATSYINHSGTGSLIFRMGGSFTERMSLDASGNLVVGVPNAIYVSRATFGYDPAVSNGPIAVDTRSFGINRGAIYYMGGKYDTAGNYRPYAGVAGLKENGTDGNSAGYLSFYINGNAADTTERARIDSSGNLLLAGTGTPTSSAGNFVLYNGTAPTGSATDGVILYAEDVSASSELKVRDEAGNVTTLSPHNFDLIPEGPSEDMAWSYYSERDGKRINVDMLKAIRLLEQLSGEKLVHIV